MDQRMDWFYLMQFADMIEELTYEDRNGNAVYVGRIEVNNYAPTRLRTLAKKLGEHRATE